MASDSSIVAPDRKYAVFISYRHADNKEQGRQWATWLHHTLETYEVPPDLVGRTNLRGEPVPASLYPVFRDEEELPADADLSANIQRALRHSALLVVLCSPRAVESRFVADEIKVFKELGKAGHILALMIDGEPNASDDSGKARAGIRPEQECLPEHLRYGVPRDDGSIDWNQRTEPIAADVRPQNQPVQGWTTTAAYREELTRQSLAKPEINRLSTAYEEQLQLATMKIIAGAIGLPLGEVTQRDKRHAEAKLKRARQELSRTEFLFARQLLDLAETQGDEKKHESTKKACAHLATSLRANPENKPAIILSSGHVKHFANRGIARIVSGSGGQLSSCGKHLLSWSENDVLIWKTSSASLAARKIGGKAKVRFAVFGQQGGQVFTTYEDGTSAVWDVESGQAVGRIVDHGSRLKFARFLGDDGQVIALTESGILSVMSLHPEVYVKQPQVHLDDPIDRFAVCNDGSRLLLAGSNGIRVFETRDLRLLAGGILEKGSAVHAAAFSPDGERMIIATANRATILHCASGKRCIKNLNHPGPVRVAAYSPDGRLILTGSDDQFARLWNADSGALIKEIAHPGPVLGGLFSPDGMRALTTSGRRSQASFSDDELLEVLTSMLSSIMNESKPDNSSMAFDADTIRLSACEQSSVWLWDVGSEVCSRHGLVRDRALSAISFNSDGSRIILSTQDGRSEIWDAATKVACANSLVLNEPVRSAQFVDEFHVLLLSGDQGRRVTLSDVRTGDIVKEFQSQISERSQPVRAVFNWRLRQLLLVDERGTVEIGDLHSGEKYCQPLLHERAVLTADISPDGCFVLTGSTDCSARLWSLHSGSVIAGPLRHSGWIRCCQFSPDGDEIVTASDDGTARIWKAQSGALKVPPLRHLGSVRSAVFSPDGTKVMTASDDGTARIWCAQSGSLAAPIIQHSSAVVSAVFSSDGAVVLTASDDGTACLWNAATGLCLSQISHQGPVSCAIFSPDGSQIFTASGHIALVSDASHTISHAQGAVVLSEVLEQIGDGRLNDQGVLEQIPSTDALRLFSKLDAYSETKDFLAWWWRDPFARPVHVNATVSIPEYVRLQVRDLVKNERGQSTGWFGRLLQSRWMLTIFKQTATEQFDEDNPVVRLIKNVQANEERVGSLTKLAKAAHPGHPLVLLCEVEQGQCSDPAWLMQYAVSRLLAEPHYLTPLEPPNAMGDAKANRQYELTLGLAEDCFLGARLLINDRTGQTRTTDPKRIELAKQVLARALKLAPESEAYRKMAAELGL